VQQAATWPERETALVAVYSALARMHNRLGITAPLDEGASSFFGRPFQVIGGGRFADAICRQITDREVLAIAARPLIGGIDHWSDSTDMRSNAILWPTVRLLYEQSFL